MLLTDVHQYKRNLDEHFSKLINNKSRIAVSATCQGSLLCVVPYVLHNSWSNLYSWVSSVHLLFSSPSLLPSLGQQTGLIIHPVP